MADKLFLGQRPQALSFEQPSDRRPASPAYRATFAEFLKIDFPRIPYPPSPTVFAHISDKGEALRRPHLMEAPAIGETPYLFEGEGDDVVASGYPKFEKSSPSELGEGDRRNGGGGAAASAAERTSDSTDAPASPSRPSTASRSPSPRKLGEDWGRVYINADQYFAGVPAIAWSFPIGGYQPAQKWLKDRRGRALSWDDIGHYQKIVKILAETDRIMKQIELPIAEA